MRGDGGGSSNPVRMAVVGAEHPHVFSMVASLLGAGAELAAVFARSERAAHDLAELFGGAPVAELEAIVADDTIDLAVVVTVPAARAEVAERLMTSGKDVLVDKPAALTAADVDRLRAAQDRTGQRCAVYFSERLEEPATRRASALVAAGAIGRVVHVVGSGPHRLGLDQRPRWFHDPALAGGILADLATHQIDQFLHFTGLTGASEPVQIVASAVANHAHPDQPWLEDHGEVHLRRGDVSGSFRVDWLTPDGLPTWGDVRLFLHGTAGTIELRKNLDLAGRPGPAHLFLVDGDGVTHVDCSDDPVTFGADLLDDVRHRTERAVDHAHTFRVLDLAVEAQRVATRHGHLTSPPLT